jgi:hypothetical protein
MQSLGRGYAREKKPWGQSPLSSKQRGLGTTEQKFQEKARFAKI